MAGKRRRSGVDCLDNGVGHAGGAAVASPAASGLIALVVREAALEAWSGSVLKCAGQIAGLMEQVVSQCGTVGVGSAAQRAQGRPWPRYCIGRRDQGWTRSVARQIVTESDQLEPPL